MHRPPLDPSPGPWTFDEHMYGIAHCLIEQIDTGQSREPGEDDE